METNYAWGQGALADTSLAERLVGKRITGAATAIANIATASALSTAFGVAATLGAPSLDKLPHALELSAIPLAFGAFYAPSVWVLLTLFNRTIEAGDVARAAMRTVSVTGIVLGGFAPAVAFFELTSGTGAATAFAAFLELVAISTAGLLALRTFVRDTWVALHPSERDALARTLLVILVCLGVVLGARFYPAILSDLHGGFSR